MVGAGSASLVLTVGYNGGAYSGFAKQKDPSISTVQGHLERAASVLFRHDAPMVCAGRTDAGVHARGQVVSCVLPQDELAARQPYQLVTSFNALTPGDIVVKRARFANAGFSARFDAVKREYRYRIVAGSAQPVFLNDFAWWRRAPLDVVAMQRAACHFVGERDFRSFCKAQSAEGKTTMRFVERVDVFEEEQMGESCLCVRVVGNAFLHSMVRTMVGSLVMVGTGQREPDWIAQALQARERAAAGETAPAKGLVFWQVTYPEGVLKDSLDEV